MNCQKMPGTSSSGMRIQYIESEVWRRFKAKALARTRDRETFIEACSFLAFKAAAVNTAHHELAALADKAGSGKIQQEPAGGPYDSHRVEISNLTLDERSLFRAHVTLDLYLFELVSIRDALLQLVNAAFDLGIPSRDVRFDTLIPALRNLSSRLATGLEEWEILLSTKGTWLWRLNDLRNEASHRHLLQVRTVMPTIGVGGDAPTQGTHPIHFWLGSDDGTSEPLATFMTRVEKAADALLSSTFERLIGLLDNRE